MVLDPFKRNTQWLIFKGDSFCEFETGAFSLEANLQKLKKTDLEGDEV